ncbi:hypothetical protein Cha6605_2708 [Chamaesiphon minutus PCC 6605]|uniref:Uncharacterized protein n=1 Tax=Chamaesiphon minutus (strain ATCC 27169 / PCC 6605) TaxID=1173020 RepID=K9UGG7_CHAP6|nr:hypothetical protein Cha6605_2708 [Chamaesiphon minutus PCC 6605]
MKLSTIDLLQSWLDGEDAEDRGCRIVILAV